MALTEISNWCSAVFSRSTLRTSWRETKPTTWRPWTKTASSHCSWTWANMKNLIVTLCQKLLSKSSDFFHAFRAWKSLSRTLNTQPTSTSIQRFKWYYPWWRGCQKLTNSMNWSPKDRTKSKKWQSRGVNWSISWRRMKQRLWVTRKWWGK